MKKRSGTSFYQTKNKQNGEGADRIDNGTMKIFGVTLIPYLSSIFHDIVKNNGFQTNGN